MTGTLNLPFFRGTTQENDTYAGAAGSISIDVEKGELRIHDGLTFGGSVVPGKALFDTVHSQVLGLSSEDIAGLTAALLLKLDDSSKGVIDGIASLDANGKIIDSQLPSYVDDVVEVATQVALPVAGETGKLYVVQENGLIYRWAGSTYALISARIESTDLLAEGSISLYFTPERARSTFSAIGDLEYDPVNGVLTVNPPIESVNGKVGDVVLTKVDVGLDSVENYTFATALEAETGETHQRYLSPYGARKALGMINAGKDDQGNWLLNCGNLPEYIATEDGVILTTEDGVILDFEF